MRVLLDAIGTITAQNTAVVRTKVTGELKALRFTEGQKVKAGQLLAEIDPRNYQAALAQVQGTLARDKAQLVNAQADLQRYRDLLAQDSIARQQVDTQEALVRQYQGTLQADQAQVDAAKLTLSYTRVTAPISGRLGLKQADLGNVVNPGDASGIVTITQTEPINAVFAVPEASLPAINEQLRAGHALPVQAWDRGRTAMLAEGSVRLLDNAIDTATGTIRMKALFANKDGALFPNQFVNITLQISTLHDVLSIPTTAVQRGTQGTYVYAVAQDGTVAQRLVTLGTTDGDRISVTGDLHAGERVVTDGADRLRDGAKVQVIDPEAAQAAAATAAAEVRTSRRSGGRAGMDKLPPEEQAKIKAMSPEERRAYFQKLREQQGNAGQAPAAATAPAGSAPAAPAGKADKAPGSRPAPASIGR
jgi:multidrug efflux system membrane fusion protein